MNRLAPYLIALSLALAQRASADELTEDTSLHVQATYIRQAKRPFSAAYSGTNRLVPEGLPFLTHTIEGTDDMPAHVKAVLSGASVTVPISGGRLNLGTWQGIYLCEFRNYGGRRKLVATVYS